MQKHSRGTYTIICGNNNQKTYSLCSSWSFFGRWLLCRAPDVRKVKDDLTCPPIDWIIYGHIKSNLAKRVTNGSFYLFLLIINSQSKWQARYDLRVKIFGYTCHQIDVYDIINSSRPRQIRTFNNISPPFSHLSYFRFSVFLRIVPFHKFLLVSRSLCFLFS